MSCEGTQPFSPPKDAAAIWAEHDGRPLRSRPVKKPNKKKNRTADAFFSFEDITAAVNSRRNTMLANP